ncbi:hypothetical protein R1flu_022740 [Riccia fluitans]|uniref:Uncharacterized protein n=1 Tax=Riccia fluitans TaxID=41844 RepID=A0ABD1XQ14_9MARC
MGDLAARAAVGHGAHPTAALWAERPGKRVGALWLVAAAVALRVAYTRKGKEPEIPELPKVGELMPKVPPPPQNKGKGPRPSQTQEEKIARLLENAEMRHAWFTWFVNEENSDQC